MPNPFNFGSPISTESSHGRHLGGRQGKTLAFLGGILALVLLVFIFGMGQQLVSLGAQGYGPLKGLATATFTPPPTAVFTPMPSLTPSATHTLPPTATYTTAPGSTSAPRADGMVMVYIPSGTFKMGSSNGYAGEQPIHAVTLDAFWMDQSEVTSAMYKKCLDAGMCQSPTQTDHFGDPAYTSFPMVYVDWNRAKAYCDWAGGNTQDVYLPSEAQWEYAARGGLEQERYPWGNDAPSCSKGATNGANFSHCNKNSAIAVKTFSPNGYGLYDMAGNVWEWVNDWHGSDYYKNSPAHNPAGPVNGTERVLRGGAWFNPGDDYLLVSYRSRNYPDYSSGYIGFRCARSR